MNENQYVTQQQPKTTELQAPDLGQVHTKYDRVKHVIKCPTLP